MTLVITADSGAHGCFECLPVDEEPLDPTIFKGRGKLAASAEVESRQGSQMGIPMWELSNWFASAHFLHRPRHNSMLPVRGEGSRLEN